jgi:hypothetical protein
MARPKSDEKARFLAKVKVMDNGCHEWQAGLHRDGYGKFQFRNRTMQSHRAAYIIFVEDPKEKCVLHKCDNRKCVNLDHLFLGSLQDNINDMDVKRRRGSNSNLTYSQVAEIKIMLDARYSQMFIAKQFGCHQTTISRIFLNKHILFKKD